jgi:hypothetical protein
MKFVCVVHTVISAIYVFSKRKVGQEVTFSKFNFSKASMLVDRLDFLLNQDYSIVRRIVTGYKLSELNEEFHKFKVEGVRNLRFVLDIEHIGIWAFSERHPEVLSLGIAGVGSLLRTKVCNKNCEDGGVLSFWWWSMKNRMVWLF